ncbi:MAG: ABC transporter ATP-binding protein [Blastocatellia bacterium]
MNSQGTLEREDRQIVFTDVSKFYGEILGVNRITLTIDPGITSLVGPNGSGKTTLMNLLTGLIQPSRGEIQVLGISPRDPEALFRRLGYCGQIDSFPRGMTGYQFVATFLRLHGWENAEVAALAWRAIERVGLADVAERKVAGYSKGMRQRIRLAQAIAHQPDVLILDEPLNGLDPMARAETIRLFQELAREGVHLILSSHILHEVDMMSDRVILIDGGYLRAEGGVAGVRQEITTRPMRILIRCDRPDQLASMVFQAGIVVEAQLHPDRQGLFVSTTQADQFYLRFNRLALESDLVIESVVPVDDDLAAVYQYLIGPQGGGE